MKKKLLMMTGAFIAGAVAATGLRHYLEKREKERLASWDEDYEDEEDEFDDFGFDEDLDIDFDPNACGKKEADAELLKDVCNHLIEHRMELSDSQVDTLLKAIELRRIELLAGVVRKGGKNE